MSNQITYGDDSRTAILRGINSLANGQGDAGTGGRNVILGRGFGAPTITKDGVTVAKEISLKDPIENLGADDPRGGQQDVGRGRRRHHGHRAGSGDLP